MHDVSELLVPDQDGFRHPFGNPKATNATSKKHFQLGLDVKNLLLQCQQRLDALEENTEPDIIKGVLEDTETAIAHSESNTSALQRFKDVEAVSDVLKESQGILSSVKADVELWRSLYSDDSPIKINNREAFINPNKGRHTPSLIAYCLALAVRVFSGGSIQVSGFVLKAIKLFGIALGTLRNGLSSDQQKAISDIPDTIVTLENHMNLGITSVPYAVCPDCHFLYKPEYTLMSSSPQYPRFCTFQTTTLSSPCGADLLQYNKPIKTFHYYSFLDWFGQFIALPEIEEYGDKFCQSIDECPVAPSTKASAKDGNFIRELKGPSGDLFIRDRGAEGRWLFKMYADFFNVEGNRIRGKTASTGLLGMMCLNLPLKMANDPAYIYIPGVIQGPQEPASKEAVHRHYLRPLVDDLVTAYVQGMRPYTTYASHSSLGIKSVPYERVFRAAIAAIIMDFKAARPFAGFLDVTSHLFCFTCKCWHKTQLGNTDYDNWDPVNDDILRQAAESWRDADKESTREAIEAVYGTRYSEFWRLPYIQLSKQLVVDPMHAWFERILQGFFRTALGLDNPKAEKVPKTSNNPKAEKVPRSSKIAFRYPFTPPPRPCSKRIQLLKELTRRMNYHSAFSVGRIHRKLTQAAETEAQRQSLSTFLKEQSQDALVFVCIDVNRLPAVRRYNKVHLVEQLMSWRHSQSFEPLVPTHIDSVALLKRVHETIKEVTTPAWVSKPPHDAGMPRAGVLKADHWRMLFEIFLPLALLSLWHTESPVAADNAKDMDGVLATSMSLVCASVIMTKNVLTPQRRHSFRQSYTRHVLGLQEHFPSFLLPSHHLAFHLLDGMERFGTLRHWWCFPFETLIGKFQRMPINHQIGNYISRSNSTCESELTIFTGQQERTMLHTFYHGSYFRRWLKRDDCPPLLKVCRDLLDKAFGFNTQVTTPETIPDEILDEYTQVPANVVDLELESPDIEFSDNDYTSKLGQICYKLSDLTVPSDLLHLFGDGDLERYSMVSAHYGFYATPRSRAIGNSYVCFKLQGYQANNWFAGQIQHIFKKDGKIKAAIRRSKELVLDTEQDPFASFWVEGFEAKMVSASFLPRLDIVDLEKIIAHTVRWEITPQIVVVLNLCRVSSFVNQAADNNLTNIRSRYYRACFCVLVSRRSVLWIYLCSSR
ncbi:hypothetical protein K435DRAFT_688521 [Dendrothele bispora CBS 962.96]|uniref:Uncharacterized protein n=1 Tax=Dendrothele bispora (strain CBS 962.96) TaxID=1314807 RepID=A0A4S8L5T4_DENBC|nr:hypothetical protein K435DRAFT_688521 [Dendrothele bispora CBS 962.96]